MSSLYIHIPFCKSKCLYCSFSSFSGKQLLHDRYTAALVKELEIKGEQGAKRPVLRSVFIGGGTPSCLSAKLMDRITSAVAGYFQLDSRVEFSIEVNPESVTQEKLQRLRETGVNRISFGIQTFNNEHLRRLGRVHNAQMAVESVLWAERAGFSNINIDLMYGLPEQGPSDHLYNLEQSLSLPIQHLSIYQLTIEDGTAFHRFMNSGTISLPADDVIEEMDSITAEVTANAGLHRYEISNYALPHCQCRHNLRYWENRQYMGVGSSAVSYQDGRRVNNEPDPGMYCESMEQGRVPIRESETLSRENSLKETVIMGLRLTRGIHMATVNNRFGIDILEFYGDSLLTLRKRALIDWDDEYLYLTADGLRFANTVMSTLV